MSEKIAQFRFKGYKVLKSTIHIDEKVQLDDDSKFDVNFRVKSKNIENNNYNLAFEISLKDELAGIEISMEILGFFEFDSNLEDEKKEVFFNSNAPAIMFPYIRAYISTLSSLSGIKPIILPTLNLANRAEKE